MKKYDVVIVGAGFTGLMAAYNLSKQNISVHVIEADDAPGGLAGSFSFNDGVTVEKFYHHWFNNDNYIMQLAQELGCNDDVVLIPTLTSVYFNKRIWKLSTPLELLRFKPLSLIDRIRLGLLVFQVRRVKDWKTIEHLTIREWLEPLCGKSVYKVVWEPLINAKFSIFSERINAVWMWNKLVLRGGTRDVKGREELAYFKGGIGSFTDKLVAAIEKNGGDISYGCRAEKVETSDKRIASLISSKGTIRGESFLFTPALSIIADIFEGAADPLWIAGLRRVKYLGNICLVLRLRGRLSETYWLNVNDSSFPFVGVIEHTNLDGKENYNGSHIVYLSQYLSDNSPVWSYSDAEYFNVAIQHLFRMFPEMEKSWIMDYKVWRSKFAQPVTERNYSHYVPDKKTPFENGWISSMAQIYPEDRGTNYAVREAEQISAELLKHLNGVSLK